MRNIVLFALVLLLGVVPTLAQDDAGGLTLTVLGTYAGGSFAEGASEIGAYDPATQTVFVTNGEIGAVDVLDVSDPTNPTLTNQLDVSEYGGGLTSVSVYGNVLAVAVPADPAQDNGSVVFFTTGGEFIAQVEVGALPDMLTFSPDGNYVLTANEGEPNTEYTVDPEGSVSIIDVSGGVENVAQDNVTTVNFADFNADGGRADELDPAIRIFGPNATVAQDLEPEYVAVSPDSSTVFVTLQENNALGVIDIASGEVTALLALGFKDHSVEGNGLDAANDDGAINITTYPFLGMYMPDAIAAYEVDGVVYLVTANEGDARDYDFFSEEFDLVDVELDPEAFPNADELYAEDQTGGLTTTTTMGDTDGDGDLDEIYIYGGRSFTIWNAADGSIVFDSGDQLEQITAEAFPDDFNSTNDENDTFDDRSDNKGPEPEGLTLGEIDGATYVFVGLERIGGVVVYDVSDPTAPVYQTYLNNRDFSGAPEEGTAGDLGPEGVVLISGENSPTGSPLLIVTNEISGTTTLYEISAGM